jgi:hypothetical protein
MVCVSPAPIGVLRGPTFNGNGLVSISRHGVIGTNTARSPEPIDADADISPPEPTVTATTAPIAAHRARLGRASVVT